jgi:CelD/BcsL family acetyltransferase involved in cellulose biosynthesis
MSKGGLVIDIQPIANVSALAADWASLEGRADCSFFQSWAWTGCLAEERFDDPWLLSARRDGNIVALALFNRGPRRGPLTGRPFLMGESGRPDLDTIFIEHNGIMLDAAEPPELAESCWAALAAFRSGLRSPRWIVSGVPEAMREGLMPHMRAVTLAMRPAPYIDLSHLPLEATLLDSLSANARQQLRRSLRAWEKIGPLRLDIAETVEQADLFLDGLQSLHQRYWTGRGKPGAFAKPFFARFHHALIRRPAEGQSMDLIRVSAGDRIVGYLYNLVHRGWVAAYQSGFDFGPDAEQLRPGLICHLQAIEHYRKAGMRLYDFLGGEARYKRSFAHAERKLLWLKLRGKSFRQGSIPRSVF